MCRGTKLRRRCFPMALHSSPQALSPFFKSFLKGSPTSGFVAMVMLLHTCQRVHLFGFNTEETLRLKGNSAFQDWCVIAAFRPGDSALLPQVCEGPLRQPRVMGWS